MIYGGVWINFQTAGFMKLIIKNFRGKKDGTAKKALFAAFETEKKSGSGSEADMDKKFAKIIQVIQGKHVPPGSKTLDALLVSFLTSDGLSYTVLRFLLFIRRSYNLPVVLIMNQEYEDLFSNTGLDDHFIIAFSDKDGFLKLARLES